MTYEQRKEALGIRSAPKSNKWSFGPDYLGAIKAEPDNWESREAAPKPPIEEDLSRFAPNQRNVLSAKAWWASLTPRQRANEVAKRRKNALIGAQKRQKTNRK